MSMFHAFLIVNGSESSCYVIIEQPYHLYILGWTAIFRQHSPEGLSFDSVENLRQIAEEIDVTRGDKVVSANAPRTLKENLQWRNIKPKELKTATREEASGVPWRPHKLWGQPATENSWCTGRICHRVNSDHDNRDPVSHLCPFLRFHIQTTESVERPQTKMNHINPRLL